MKKSKFLQSLAITLLGLATTMPALAELRQNSAGDYEIASATDYEEFRQMVATGNPYANAVLTADITVKDVIGKGDVQFHYRGTFDGQGHTITMDNVANDTGNHPWGLFQYTEPGCVIKNLKVSGAVTNRYEALGSIVGEARGTRVENCISDATLTANSYAGGLIGAGYGVNFVENCAFIGSINVSEAYGIIGYVHNNVEIKSCYVDATFSSPSNSNQFMKKTDAGQIFLNNYYHKRSDVAAGQETGVTMVSSSDDMSNGKLCLDLNINGRNGVVWYQHGDHPYPFMGTNGQFVTWNSTYDQPIIGQTKCPVNGHIYTGNHEICGICGALDPDREIDPLQSAGEDHMYATDEIYVGLIRYKLNSDGTATVKGTHKNVKGTELATAVHIPEVIRYQNKDYTVTKIDFGSLAGSQMEYCYIPKTVKRIEHDAFNKCTSLKYLHIADCPSVRKVSDDNLWLGLQEEATPDEELFHDCSNLTTVYIGRDLQWHTSSLNPDEPFEDRHSITDVFFGPRVSRVGNYENEDARAGLSYDLFNDCTGIRRVYIMGDEQSLKEGDLYFYIRDGLAKATDYYINRTIGYTNFFEYSVGRYDDMGCLDRCERVAYGPFVKSVMKDSFRGTASNNNTTLQFVDFTNAFGLEAIGDNAFNECSKAYFVGLSGQYPLKSIGNDAFYNCDKLTDIKFGSQLVSIGEQAFEDCELLSYISIPGTTTSIGIEAFHDCPQLIGVKFEDSTTSLNIGDLVGRFDGSTSKIASIYIGRELIGTIEDSPFTDSKATLSSVEFGPLVTFLPQGFFANLKTVNSVSFDYAETPFKFINRPDHDLHATGDITITNMNHITSLFVNRKLVDNNGNELIGEKWYDLRKTVKSITFGDKIIEVKANTFADFTALSVLNLPKSLKTLGESAFSGCRNLSSLIIMGPTAIGASAFASCSALETIFLFDKAIQVGDQAFSGCSNIKDITFNADNSSLKTSAANAFENQVYQTTPLYSTFDQSDENVVFTHVPWSLFNIRPLKHTNNFSIDTSEPSGIFEHASIPREVNEGQLDLFYIPFQWDPYFFGSDAEVYALDADEDGRYEETYNDIDVNKGIGAYNTNMSQVAILTTHTLPAGIYAVKTQFPATAVHATRNLFFDNGVKVNNAQHFLKTSDSETGSKIMVGGNDDSINPGDTRDNYVLEDGVIKLVNGTHSIMAGDVVLSGSSYADLQEYNVKLGSKYTYTSKMVVPFHALLEGYATFYNEVYNVLAPEWCTVYVVSGEDNGTVQLAEIEDRVITAGQAVVIKTERNAAIGANDLMTYVTNGSSATDLYEQNLLKGVNADTPVVNISGSDGYVYVLSCNSQNEYTGFYKYSNGKTLGAGKAYLKPSDFNGPAKACLFTFGDANGINNVTTNDSTGTAYDITGKRIDPNQTEAKGIYVIDNKKVIK